MLKNWDLAAVLRKSVSLPRTLLVELEDLVVRSPTYGVPVQLSFLWSLPPSSIPQAPVSD